LEWISKVVKHHKEWVKIVNSFGEYFFAEDIVQETYLMLLKWSNEEKLFTNGNLNKSYVWLALKNTFLQHVNKANKMQKVDLDSIAMLPDEAPDVEKHESFNCILNQVENIVDDWHWYDQMLFNLYKDSDMSMREISKETNISVTSIFHTLKYCKTRIKENIGENYQDYKNKDYELIK